MKEHNIGDDIRFIFKGVVCFGQIITVSGHTYTVNFVYTPGDGRAPENVTYTIPYTSIL
jgi:hypothetical protein